jgi:hypothetical protein
MRSRVLLFGIFAALALLVTAAKPAAQTWDERAYFTFSGPVELPGVGLPPGKYVFRLANPETGRSMVQVLSADGKRPYGIFFTRAVERPSPPLNPEVRFMEAAPGAPPPIKTWWNAGDRIGREFVYPKEQARRLAQNASQPVLTTQGQTTTTAQTNTSDVSRISSSGQETRVSNDATTVAAEPSGTAQSGERAPEGLALARPAVVATVAYTDKIGSTLPPPTPPAQPAQVARARTNLPQTSSSLPLVGLIALCFLLGAAAVRSFRSGRV